MTDQYKFDRQDQPGSAIQEFAEKIIRRDEAMKENIPPTDREKIAAIAREMGLTFRKGFPHVMNEAFIMDESCNENETRHFDPLTDGRDTLAVIEHFHLELVTWTGGELGDFWWEVKRLDNKYNTRAVFDSADLKRAVVECAYLCCGCGEFTTRAEESDNGIITEEPTPF